MNFFYFPFVLLFLLMDFSSPSRGHSLTPPLEIAHRETSSLAPLLPTSSEEPLKNQEKKNFFQTYRPWIMGGLLTVSILTGGTLFYKYAPLSRQKSSGDEGLPLSLPKKPTYSMNREGITYPKWCPDLRDRRAINRPIEIGKDGAVKKPSKNVYYPLHGAVLENNEKLVQLLLDYGADPNCINRNSQTPLHLACQQPVKPSLVRILLDYGASMHMKNNRKDEPILYTLYKNNMKALKEFFSGGSEKEAQQQRFSMNRTLLFYASSSQAVDFLVEKGFDVDFQDEEGNTPLHIIDKQEVILALLRHQARRDILNKKGLTATEYQEKCEKEMAQLIRHGIIPDDNE